MDKKIILNTEFVPDEEIKNLTLYRNAGKIRGAFYPKTQNEMKNLYLFLKTYHLPFFVVGNGSNLLIRDNAHIFALSTKKLKQSLQLRNSALYVSASYPLASICSFCMNHGYGGFEGLSHIPATVGGAIKMNASAFGQSIFDNLESVTVLGRRGLKQIKKDEIKYAYHKTNLDDCIILSAKFRVNKAKLCEIRRNFANFLIKREQSQPKGFCCGSVFKNPSFAFAGDLIEKCGLKGLKYGGAQISPTHANFIVNNGNASFEEIKYLIDLAQECVFKKFGILLEREVEIIE